MSKLTRIMSIVHELLKSDSVKEAGIGRYKPGLEVG